MVASNSSAVVFSSNIGYGISDEVVNILKWIIYTVMCQAIDIFGMATNIINIVCFVKQGFKDPVTISLLGLSISDFGCLTTLLLTNIILLFNSVASPRDLNFDPLDINYLIHFMTHLAFARVTSWITAIITLERCMCIVAPLKVKTIITQRRMTTIIAGVFFVLFVTGAPVYAVNGLAMKFSPERNATILGRVSWGEIALIETISFAVNNFFIPSTSFVIIIVCTVILVFKLDKMTKWRQQLTNQGTTEMSSRNQKVSKMVVMISVLFISCFIPLSVVMLTLSFIPELSLNGKYLNIGIVLAGIGFVLESVNSSSNIFIYYHMSSKYRDTFNAIFFRMRSQNLKHKYS